MPHINVMVAGKFDPLHQGHIDHIIKASKLGEWLIVATHPDDIVARNSTKRFCAIPLATRMIILRGVLKELKIKGEVMVSIDDDGTVTKTLAKVRPDIFAKGGDRVVSNMPQSELDICDKLGIKVVYGIGELLNSSSSIYLKKQYPQFYL